MDLHVGFKTEGVLGLDECLFYGPFTWKIPLSQDLVMVGEPILTD